MLRDIELGGQTNVEPILGFMLNKASEANVAHRTFVARLHTSKLSSGDQSLSAIGLSCLFV
jgi:hypothetical protein